MRLTLSDGSIDDDVLAYAFEDSGVLRATYDHGVVYYSPHAWRSLATAPAQAGLTDIPSEVDLSMDAGAPQGPMTEVRAP